jgi:hypothetical protein
MDITDYYNKKSHTSTCWVYTQKGYDLLVSEQVSDAESRKPGTPVAEHYRKSCPTWWVVNGWVEEAGGHQIQYAKEVLGMGDNPELIKNWDELKDCKSDTHTLEVDDCCGWIRRKVDDGRGYFENNHYLSTHTFYGSCYESSTKLLQKCGFNVRLENWDKDS